MDNTNLKLGGISWYGISGVKIVLQTRQIYRPKGIMSALANELTIYIDTQDIETHKFLNTRHTIYTLV